MSDADLETGIPLLTEMVVPAAHALPAHAEAPTLPVALPLPVEPTTVAVVVDAAVRERQLEQDISARVLHQLMTDIDAILEPRMRDSLSELLEAATTVLAAEFRQSLQTTLGEVVSTAVAQELEKHRFEKSKNN
jgi:hypothetical protein